MRPALHIISRTTWSLILTMAMLQGVIAQDKPEPPRRQGGVSADSVIRPDQRLPQIDLPEFLITGKERIDLPEFSKTTLDEDRIFDASSRKPGPGQRESTDISLGGSIKEQIGFGGSSGGFNGKVTAGYGTFQTPFFDGWFGRSFGTSDFLLKAGYKASDGHVSNADFRRGYSGLSGGFYLSDDASMFPGARLQGNVGFQGDGFNLYGSRVPDRRRTVNRFLTDVSLMSAPAEPFSYTSGVHIRSTSLQDSASAREVLLGFEFTGTGDVGPLEVKGDAGLWTSFLTSPSKLHNPYYTQFGAGARYTLDNTLDFTGGATLFMYRGSDLDARARFYPRIGITWYTSQWIQLFARFEPMVQRSGLSQIVEANPYVFHDAGLRHHEVVNNLGAGVEVELVRRVKVRAAASYKQIRNAPIYLDAASQGIWAAEYFGLTRVVAFDGDLYADITSEDYLAASISIRGNKNSVTGKRTPYFPSALVSGLYQHRFPFGLTVGTAVKLTGQQYTDIQNTSSMTAFTLVDINVEFVVIPGLSVLGMMNNVFNQPHRWWEGYQGLTRTAALGMSYNW